MIRTSRDLKSFNPITGEVVIQSYELKENNKPFKPMFRKNIQTGETIIDRRENVYWKV